MAATKRLINPLFARMEKLVALTEEMTDNLIVIVYSFGCDIVFFL